MGGRPQSLLERAFEVGSDPVLILDQERGTVLAHNRRARELFGDLGEVTEMFDLIGQAILAEAREGVATRLHVRCEDDLCLMDAMLHALPSTNDTQGGWLLTLRPAVRQPAQALARARRMELMGRLARNVGHEFKNVLQAVRLAGEELEQFRDGPDLVLRGIHEALSLGGDLLASWHALADGRVRRRRVSLQELMLRSDKLFRVLGRGAANIEVQTSDDPLFVEGDEGQLVQILLTMIFFARDSIVQAEGTGLWLSADTTGEQIVVSVRHDGRGMPEHELGRVFDDDAPELVRYQSLRSLWELVQTHRGEVSITSPIVGSRGVEVRVGLPAARTTRTLRDTSHRLPLQPRWLLVECDAAVGNLVRRCLCVTGLALEEVSAATALDGSHEGDGGLVTACLVDLDSLTKGDHHLPIARLAAWHRRIGKVPMFLLAGTLDAELRRQLVPLLESGTRLLRKPLVAGAVLRAMASSGSIDYGAREDDGLVPRFHGVS